MRAYSGNRDEAIASVIEANPVATAVRSLMASREDWFGTATELLAALSSEVSETVRRGKNWPATPTILSNRLRRAATFLRIVGIDIAFDREGHSRTRTIRVSHRQESSVMEPSAPSAPSADQAGMAVADGSDCWPARTAMPLADGDDGQPPPSTVRENLNESANADAADAADAKISSDSGQRHWRKTI